MSPTKCTCQSLSITWLTFSVTEHTKSVGITALCLPQNNLIIAPSVL